MRNWFLRFFTGNYNILLILLFFLFVFRPYDYNEIYTGVWKSLLTLALIIAIFNSSHRLATKLTISVLAIPIIIYSWIDFAYRTPDTFIVIELITAIFMLICAASIVYDVLVRARVTLETLRGVICAYFLAAFVFAYVYMIIEFIHPGTMSIHSQIMPVFPHPRYLSEMLYFSFGTLLTIGFGDIVPIKEWGQTVAVMEGIIGQFYMAILVARIVSVYTLSSDKQLLQAIENDIHNKR
jgi:hypothetical protein